MAIATTKVCAGCEEERPAVDFFVQHDKRNGRNYLSARCRPCHYAKTVAYRKMRRERDGFDAIHTLATYGVTLEQYGEMLMRQGGVCAVCGREPEPSKPHGALVVDHDHDSGRVRGLLCRTCNAGIGALNDDPALLAAALEYLEGGDANAA